MAILSLARQWRHEKLEVNLSQEQKFILHYGFFLFAIIFDV